MCRVKNGLYTVTIYTTLYGWRSKHLRKLVQLVGMVGGYHNHNKRDNKRHYSRVKKYTVDMQHK
jgi:hypothetical protein